MDEKVTGYDGEKLGSMVDHHDKSGKYLGTSLEAAKEEKGCLEQLVLVPFLGVLWYLYRVLSGG